MYVDFKFSLEIIIVNKTYNIALTTYLIYILKLYGMYFHNIRRYDQSHEPQINLVAHTYTYVMLVLDSQCVLYWNASVNTY